MKEDNDVIFGTIFDPFGQIIHVKEGPRQTVGITLEGEQLQPGFIHSYHDLESIRHLKEAIIMAEDYLMDLELLQETGNLVEEEEKPPEPQKYTPIKWDDSQIDPLGPFGYLMILMLIAQIFGIISQVFFM